MWNFADRSAKLIADLTVGTVIVLVHVAIADRKKTTTAEPARHGRWRDASTAARDVH
jgi:hypothetical protein